MMRNDEKKGRSKDLRMRSIYLRIGKILEQEGCARIVVIYCP